jgi:hypothetical protein
MNGIFGLSRLRFLPMVSLKSNSPLDVIRFLGDFPLVHKYNVRGLPERPFLRFRVLIIVIIPTVNMRVSFVSIGLLAASLASLTLADDDCQEIVRFPITLTWEKGSPDGFERDMIFMNGQFPGPPLEINEGATVEVG